MKSPAQPAGPSPSAHRWSMALAVVVISAGIVIAYHNSLWGPFIFDDEPAILENQSIRQLWPLWKPLAPPGELTVSGRPLANLTLAFNHAISGTNVWSYHALNLTIHLCAGLALLGVVRRTLLRPPLRERFGRDALLLAALVAMLWSLHPLQTEAVTYVVQRVESLMGLFLLLTLYCFIRSVDSPRPRLWQAGVIAACLLGVATKEIMATAPVLVMLYDRTFVAGSFREAWRRRRWLHGTLVATWLPLAWLVAGTGWDRHGTSGFDIGIAPWAYWLTQFEAVARYLWLSVWPHPLVFEYGTFWVQHAREVVPYALVVVPLAVFALVALWRWPVPGFLGAWFFVILAPTSIMPGRIQMIVEHRMYLPLAAVIALAVAGAHALAGRRSLLVFLALPLALGWMTLRRNEVYRNELSLWSDTMAKRPDNDRGHNNLANALLDAGRIPEAIEHYRAALRFRPDYLEAHSNLGNALLEAGRVPEAIAECETAVRLKPDYVKGHNNLGNALLRARRVPEAIAHYETALRFKPDNADAHYNLGNALLGAGRISEALDHYEVSLRFKPDEPKTHYNLGNALFQLGRMPEAIARYEAALRLKPDYADAHNNLGSALLQVERVPEAIAQFEAGLQLKPAYAEGHNNLGAALFQAGRIADAAREFETAVRLKPDYADARRNLEQARARLAPP